MLEEKTQIKTDSADYTCQNTGNAREGDFEAEIW